MKKHWNSFNTEFFLLSDHVVSRLEGKEGDTGLRLAKKTLQVYMLTWS